MYLDYRHVYMDTISVHTKTWIQVHVHLHTCSNGWPKVGWLHNNKCIIIIKDVMMIENT